MPETKHENSASAANEEKAAVLEKIEILRLLIVYDRAGELPAKFAEMANDIAEYGRKKAMAG